MSGRDSPRRLSSRSIALTAAWLAACGSNTELTKTNSGPPGTVPPVDGSPGEASPDDASPAAQSEWMMLGYDLASTYFNHRETKISAASAGKLVRAWEFDTKSEVTSTPVVSRGRVYVSTAFDPAQPGPGGVIAIDLATGQVVWQNASVRGFSSLALDAGTLYMHDSGGVVRALDAEIGEQLWEYKTDENPSLVGYSSPIVTKDFVLVGGSSAEEVAIERGMAATFRGFVVALNKRDGTLAWKKHTVEPPSNGATVWSTLSVDEAAGVVFASTSNNYTGVASDTSDAFLALPLAGGANLLWKQRFSKAPFTRRGRRTASPRATSEPIRSCSRPAEESLRPAATRAGTSGCSTDPTGPSSNSATWALRARTRAAFSTAALGMAATFWSRSTAPRARTRAANRHQR